MGHALREFAYKRARHCAVRVLLFFSFRAEKGEKRRVGMVMSKIFRGNTLKIFNSVLGMAEGGARVRTSSTAPNESVETVFICVEKKILYRMTVKNSNKKGNVSGIKVMTMKLSVQSPVILLQKHSFLKWRNFLSKTENKIENFRWIRKNQFYLKFFYQFLICTNLG